MFKSRDVSNALICVSTGTFHKQFNTDEGGGAMRCCLALLLTAVALLICLAETAFARDLDGRYASSPLSDWYKAQVNQVGALCCDDADGHEVTEWGHGPNGYWVEFDGMRHDVPAESLVNGAHPQGKAVVWIYPRGTDIVRCFMPGMEG